MECVLDCSVALAWALPDETSSRANRLLTRLPRRGALWVPALWWYELANALTMAQRHGRLTPADAGHALELYRKLPIRTDASLNAEIAWRFQALARTHGLSAYDAAYLELAERRRLPLATLDRALRAAAKTTGVDLVKL